MSYVTRDAIEEIREAGRGHLIPDYDPDWYEQPTDEDREFLAQEDDSDRRFEQGQYNEGDGVATKLYGAPELVEESDA